MIDYAKRYDQKVNDGNQIASEEIKRKSRLDLINRKKAVEDKNYPYYFDIKIADRYASLAKLISPEPLSLFQLAIIQNMNAWRFKSNPRLRRYTENLVTMARKNAKSYLASIELLSVLLQLESKNETNKQLYIVSTRLDQSLLTLNTCKDMMRRLQSSSEIARHFKLNRTMIYSTVTGSKIEAIPSNTDLNGYNPTAINIDEVEGLKDDKVIQVMKSSLGLSGGFIMMTSTAGFNMNSPIKTEWDTVEDILKNNDTKSRIQGYIYTQNSREELNNPRSWVKSNPLLSVPSVAKVMKPYLKEQLHSASIMNTINSTTTKNFNVFGNSNDNGFIDPQQWKSNTVKPISPINRSDVVIGVDLSHTRDLTSISWSFKLDDDKYYCDTFSFVPTNKGTIKAKSKADGINYEALEQDNYCKVCRDAYGYVPDTEAPKYIRYLVEHYHLKTPVTVAFDKWGANYLIQALGNDSRFNLVAVKQNSGNLSETILWLYKLIVSHKLVHENNPLFDYGFHNISMVRTFTGLPYFNKHRNVEKIDNVFSLLNSLFIQKSLKQQAKTSISNELKNNDFIF